MPIWLQGFNPLHWACRKFRADVAEYLLDKTRIDPLAKMKDGRHALMLAVRELGEGEAADQGLPILELIHRKAPEALELPDQQGKEMRLMPTWCDFLRTVAMISSRDAGSCPAHFSAQNGHVRCLQRLLELGVDRDPRDEEGRTPLHLSALASALDSVKVLAAAGADVSAKSTNGKTAAQMAKANGHTEVARYLVEQSVQRARSTAATGPSSSQAAAPPAPRPALSSSVVLSGRRCHTCNKQQDEPRVSVGACAGCLCTFYCSAACQQLDWGRGHEAACLGRLRRFLEAARTSGLEVAEDHPVARRLHAA